jgi:hypothetical protein
MTDSPKTTRNRGYPRRSGYKRVDKGFYVEPRWSVHGILNEEEIVGKVLDPCCGTGTIPSVCLQRGIPARGSDLVYRGFGEVRNLFDITEPVDNIISNVPYDIAEKCARRMLTLVRRKLILILPLTFIESGRRENFYEEHPPVRVWGCSDRPSMPPGCMEGERDRFGAVIQPVNTGGTMPYGWFVWERGYHGGMELKRMPLMPLSMRRLRV